MGLNTHIPAESVQQEKKNKTETGLFVWQKMYKQMQSDAGRSAIRNNHSTKLKEKNADRKQLLICFIYRKVLFSSLLNGQCFIMSALSYKVKSFFD